MIEMKKAREKINTVKADFFKDKIDKPLARLNTKKEEGQNQYN